jgi:uncharacterized protein
VTDPWAPPGEPEPDRHSLSVGAGDSADVVPDPADLSGAERLDVRWGMPDAVITLVLTMVLAIGAISVLALIGRRPSGAELVMVGTLVPWVALLGWPLYASWRKGRGPVADYGLGLDRATVRAGLKAGVLAVVLASMVGLLTITLSGQEITSAAGEIARRIAQEPAALILLILVAVIGAPIVEEIAFRGLLFGALIKRGVPPWLTVLLTALAFSLYHLEPERIPLLLVTGIVLGEVRRRTGRTSAAIVAHMVNNSVAALGLLTLL